MAITETVRGALARFGPRSGISRIKHLAVRDSDTGDRGIVRAIDSLGRAAHSAGAWLLPRAVTVGAASALILLWLLVVAVTWSGRTLRAFFRVLPRIATPLRLFVLAGVLTLLGVAAASEMRSSRLQAWYFTRLDRDLQFTPQPGPSNSLHFPQGGPYDERLGYAGLPRFLDVLQRYHFTIESQAAWSPGLDRFVSRGGYPIYPEKARAGLSVSDRSGAEIFTSRVPLYDYKTFDEIPPLVVNSLLYIEDRYLFDQAEPQRNAAVEWNRFLLAAVGRAGSWAVPSLHLGGASTLATQIEKFRHSPQGRTGAVREKLRQMVTASARVYMDGPDTTPRREQIVVTYLNATPLSSRPGYGEVIGIPDALWVWYGTDPEEADRVLKADPRNPTELARKGAIYRQVLSLLLAGRGPSRYLLADRAALETLTDRYLRLLCDAGIIDATLRDAAIAADLQFRQDPPPIAQVAYRGQKATQKVRAKLMNWFQMPSLYPLDRLDLGVETTVDTEAQARVAEVLQRLGDPKVLKARGMIGHQLLGDADPTKVTYSFVLYECAAGRNLLRIHADSLNEAFDINSGAKLMLGSTAKLRTLATYLGIIEQLHRRFARLPVKQLTAHAAAAPDPLTAWAATYMARAGDRSLQPMLEAAMQRHYSGAPASFSTGGGVQGFGNFERDEDIQNPTVAQAFAHSVNLAFVRLLQDITSFYGTGTGRPQLALLTDRDNPQREAYLRRFADQDGKRYLARFYKDYRGLDGNQALDLLAQRTRPVPRKLAAAYLSVHPDARLADLRNFLTRHLPQGALDDDRLWDSYLGLSPLRMSLADRAYVAGVHPLELWLVSHLQDHPNASRQELVAASEQTRQEVYGWLFKGSTHKQDVRIRLLLEQDAFERILEDWRRLGYPFAHLIPSLGTAIGASGDRPEALAELMGIILNDGVRQPTVDIERLHFAIGTPYETNLVAGGQPQRVMSVEVARTLRQTLTGVVAQGTASRLRGAYVSASGEPMVIGGKTGTGDNRFDRFSRGGGIISSRVVDRTATFVFFLGDRFYGTVTAYVPGEQAAKYHFTSGLAVQLLKSLEPELRPLLDSPAVPSSPPAAATAVMAFEPVKNVPQSGSSAPPTLQRGPSNPLAHGDP